MTPLYFYDDATARGFEPFALTRPACELRAGAELVRARWTRALDGDAAGFVAGAHLSDFDEAGAPGFAPGTIPAGSVVVNARCVPALGAVRGDAAAWVCQGRIATVRLTEALPVARLADGTLALESLARGAGAPAELTGRWLDEVWDLVRELTPQLVEDIRALARELQVAPPPAHAVVIGEHPVHVEQGATVEPHTVFDTHAGPVLVRSGSTIHAFTRIVGPCFVGRDTTVATDKVANCSIGDVCRVHGELSSSILIGHVNKAHDGFVGHSVMGRWVNLGAGTTTSNLKNTYGTVQLWTPTGIRETGLQFLGTLFGDHVKTGIGLRLSTGTVLGAGANVFDAMPPKAVAPFSWGSAPSYEVYAPEKFVAVAERAMARRSMPLTDKARRQLLRAHAERWEA